ncbi:MAG: uncharacterized protein QOD75_2097 [Blastocatellia bacterium]|jgi:protein associated with RNAse G/E|nr:uncharacterized protein [Blastocatellia bacterium]
MPERVTVNVQKFDGSAHRSWHADIVSREGPLIILDGEFAETVDHELLGRITQGTRSLEYYWLDRWFNVFRFLEDSGALKNFYCNINLPPVLNQGVLCYIDLDIDVLVEPDFSYRVVDTEEFEANVIRLNYPAEVQKGAKESLAELLSLIETRQFPFA